MTPRHKVIGVGGKRTHLEAYIRAFAADDRCEVVAIADEPGLSQYREGQNRLLASELRVPYMALGEALKQPGVDIVCACPDVERRARVITTCLAAGKHVYLDKPLAGSIDDAMAIAESAEAVGTVTQMFTHVNAPWARSARRAFKSGATGELSALHCDMLMAKGHLPDDLPIEPREERGSDGSFTFVEAKRELFDMGVYPISIVNWLSGQRVKQVTALTGNYFFEEHRKLDIEDFGAILLTLEDGTVATVTCGRIGVKSHPQGGRQGVTLIGENGYFNFGESEPRVEVYNDRRSPEPPRHPMDPMMMWGSTRQEVGEFAKNEWISMQPGDQAADIRAFLDCIDKGERPQVTASDAVHHIEVILAAYDSAASRRTVSIPPSRL